MSVLHGAVRTYSGGSARKDSISTKRLNEVTQRSLAEQRYTEPDRHATYHGSDNLLGRLFRWI
jgi:hypothetical protein